MIRNNALVRSRKFDNKVRRSWECELIERRGDLLIFLGEFDRDVEHGGLGSIRRGTLSYEYYWLNRWYNIFRFHEPDGTFRNFYCNINMPPTFTDGVLDYIDLDIDVIVDRELHYEVVDRDDFTRNSLKYGYPDDVKAKVEETLNELIRLVEARSFPFDSIGDRNIR